MDIQTYFHTLRHLKAGQIYARLIRKLRRPQIDSRPAPDIRTGGRQDWVQPVKRPQSMLGPATFCFLNQTHTLHWPQGWNDAVADKLWLYNLHYFDDLHAQGAEERTAWHHRLLLRWVDENPPGKGNGWEPYPTSLRVVNWVKWALAGNTLPEAAVHSLAVQVRWLGKHLEYHLLGNHLFANAKALVFAGAFFEGQEARQWMDKGLAILAREIPEQILPDGGHFERSPMYHAIAVEDMADLVNICRAYPHSLPQQGHELVRSWPDTVQRMLEWLQAMCHPDGNIVLLNDAALNIAPGPKQLAQYCQRLGIRPASRESGERLRVTQLPDTGYIRVDAGEAVAFLDTAPIGPDYLPGHAHADTLTFALSVWGQRLIVDSGASCYGLGPERLRQRSTAAHNTVVVDGKDSSEVWSGFRVARRAYPKGLTVRQDHEVVTVQCSHDGYTRLPGSPVHTRRWEFTPGKLGMQDSISDAQSGAQARLHLHPAWHCRRVDGHTADLHLAPGKRVRVAIRGGQMTMEESTWHPEFGASLPNICLVLDFYGQLYTEIGWDV
ncbi:heparinase II/III family protein [Desulfohalobium retbaense]|nr:heparinase II/III family protein [Desulfohalobium retbaense]